MLGMYVCTFETDGIAVDLLGPWIHPYLRTW